MSVLRLFSMLMGFIGNFATAVGVNYRGCTNPADYTELFVWNFQLGMVEDSTSIYSTCTAHFEYL